MEIKVLDHGFIRLVDVMGTDASIVQAARVSYGAGTKSVNEDRGLIRYLMSHRHTSPFEMCELKFHIKAPMFIARQWVRHRTASWNEVSARYSEMKEEYYTPKKENITGQNKENKQGGGEELTQFVKIAFQADVEANQEDAHSKYVNALEHGVAREQARMLLPVNLYTEWYWKIDLHNLFHFLKLRMDAHAQWEIREYANVIAEIVADKFPLSWEAFQDYQMGGISFNRKEKKVLLDFLRCHGEISLEKLCEIEGDFTQREMKEFMKKISDK